MLKRSRSFALLLVAAGLNMGNQSCQQSAAPAPRLLKMDVVAGRAKARPITLPNGEQVDFPTIASDLFFQQIMLSDRFVINNPISSSSVAPVGGLASMEILGSDHPTDAQLLAAYGFTPPSPSTNFERSAPLSIESESALPKCLYDGPQALLSSAVIAFATDGGGGVSIGYGAGSAAIGGSVNFTDARLEVAARTDDPLSNQPIVIGDGVSHQDKISFAFTFPAGINVGLNFFYQTPIATTIKRAFDASLAGVVSGYKKLAGAGGAKSGGWNDVWESRVLYDPNIANNATHIAFRAGYRAGVQAGDQFAVRNMHYQWKGVACESDLDYRIPTSTAPIAIATVIEAGDNVAVATVRYLAEEQILPGAQVKILALLAPPPSATVIK